LLALLANLDGGLEAVHRGPAAAGAVDGNRDAFIVAAAGGGLALVAPGMSPRVVVGWLDLPAPDPGRAARSWWLLAAGAALRAAGAPLDQEAPPGQDSACSVTSCGRSASSGTSLCCGAYGDPGPGQAVG
jgi:hypothetical protein